MSEIYKNQAPELMSFLNDLESKTNNNPVDFGKGLIRSSGGLYGFNKIGFNATLDYIRKSNVVDDVVPHNKYRERNVLSHEDCFTSYAFWKSTGYPVIWNSNIAIKSFYSNEPPEPMASRLSSGSITSPLPVITN